MDPFDKVRRKRVLISSDYRSAFKRKQIFDVYYELNQSNWVTEANPCLKAKKYYSKVLAELAQKYEHGIVHIKQPAKRDKKKLLKLEKFLDNPDNNVDDSDELRMRNNYNYQMRKHTYSLFNPKNAVISSEPIRPYLPG